MPMLCKDLYVREVFEESSLVDGEPVKLFQVRGDVCAGGRFRLTVADAFCMIWTHLISTVSESLSIRVSAAPMGLSSLLK